MARNSMGNIVEDFSKLTDEKKEEMATLFSEGNEDLKNLLLTMWNNGIQTYACCAGHDKSEAKTVGGMVESVNPYIYFDVKNLSEKQQLKLYKSLIIAGKMLRVIGKIEFRLDQYMGFEKHGLTLRLFNDPRVFALLNDIFNEVLKKESVVEKVKRFLVKKDKNFQFMEDENDFVKAIIDLNKFSLKDYSDSTAVSCNEDKISFVELEYQIGKGVFFSMRDGVESHVCCEDNGDSNYWFAIAENYYTQDPYKYDVYYTYENGQQKTLTASQLGCLQEYTEDRKFNYSTRFNERVYNITMSKIQEVLNSNNLNV